MAWNQSLEWRQEGGIALFTQAFSLDRSEASQDLSSGALNFTTSIADKFKVIQVLAHASAGINETVSVYFNSKTGANYDTLIGIADFDGNTDIAFISGDNLKGVVGEANDEITVACSNGGGTGIVYVTILVEILA